MSEYVKIKRKLYDELIDVKAKYVTLCKMLETMQAVYEENKPKEMLTPERSQTKWVKIFENPFTNGYLCPFCGHKIQVTEQFLPQVTECEACGADMRGGAE